MMKAARLLALTLAAAFLLVAAAQEPVTVAEGLNGPMGLAVDAEGNLWIVDSGTGGDQQIEVAGGEGGEATTVTFGNTARLIRVSPDGEQTVVAELPSVFTGMEASGGSRVAVADGTVYVTSGSWNEEVGSVEQPPLMGHLVRVVDGEATSVANLWAFEQENNPDPNMLDSNPYGVAVGPDGMIWVADAGGNSVLEVDPETGEVSLVAVLEGIPGPLPNPGRGGAMESDPVPTGIAVAEDGTAYVALLPGFPFLPGSSKVVSISPEGEVSDFATGLTMTTDLQMAPDGALYAVQMGEFTEQGPVPNAGKLVRIAEDGTVTEVLTGLSFPTGLAIAPNGDVYLTVNGMGGPGGAVVRYEGLAAAQ